jgi:hypothetical protein
MISLERIAPACLSFRGVDDEVGRQFRPVAQNQAAFAKKTRPK